MYKLCRVILLLLALLKEAELFPFKAPWISNCGDVFLTISSYKHTYLEMNWIVDSCIEEDPRQPDLIALYDSDPSTEHANEILRLNPEYYEGFFRTTIPFGYPPLPGNWNYSEIVNGTVNPIPGRHCFPYWIASLRAGTIIDTRCLAINPTWMDDNREKLAKQEIGETFIPGTHNSGTYLGLLYVDDFVVNQDRSIWTQLVFGIRYLDLRIGYYKSMDQFTVNHDLISIGDIEPLLDEIKGFVSVSPGEIVILDFHRFPFPKNFPVHDRFVQLLRSKFGEMVFPRWWDSRGPTFEEIWAANKSIIICYGDNETVEENKDFLWPPLYQYWGNKQSVGDLKDFIEFAIYTAGRTNNNNQTLWSIMAELTPSAVDVFFKRTNLRQMADSVNHLITKWFRNEFMDDINIVATDFFLGNDIINVAIDRNTKWNS